MNHRTRELPSFQTPSDLLTKSLNKPASQRLRDKNYNLRPFPLQKARQGVGKEKKILCLLKLHVDGTHTQTELF